MCEDETIFEFNVPIHYIANNSFDFCEKILDEKLGRKILRSLSKRFHMNVTSIEEVQKVSTVKIDELICFLFTFKMAIDEKSKKKRKVVVFKVKIADYEDQVDHKSVKF